MFFGRAPAKGKDVLDELAFGLYAHGRLEEALERHAELGSLRPRDRRWRYMTAKTLQRLGRVSEAVAAYRQLLVDAGDWSEAPRARWWLDVLERKLRQLPPAPPAAKG
jgi:tetratricopeptide (TPR) repeat protein